MTASQGSYVLKRFQCRLALRQLLGRHQPVHGGCAEPREAGDRGAGAAEFLCRDLAEAAPGPDERPASAPRTQVRLPHPKGRQEDGGQPGRGIRLRASRKLSASNRTASRSRVSTSAEGSSFFRTSVPLERPRITRIRVLGQEGQRVLSIDMEGRGTDIVVAVD